MIVGDVVGSRVERPSSVASRCFGSNTKLMPASQTGENAAGGFGLTAQTADEMFASGVDFITGGNHTFDKRDFGDYLESSDRVIRPANYPPGLPGRGAGTFTVDGVTIGVLNLMGRTFMPPVDDPFRCADVLVDDLRVRTPVVVVDSMPKPRSEKVAHGPLSRRPRLLRRRDPHPRANRRRADLAEGNRYLSDLGMTGPMEGVIGMDEGAVLERFRTGISERFSVQKTGMKQFCAAVVGINLPRGSR